MKVISKPTKKPDEEEAGEEQKTKGEQARKIDKNSIAMN